MTLSPSTLSVPPPHTSLRRKSDNYRTHDMKTDFLHIPPHPAHITYARREREDVYVIKATSIRQSPPPDLETEALFLPEVLPLLLFIRRFSLRRISSAFSPGVLTLPRRQPSEELFGKDAAFTAITSPYTRMQISRRSSFLSLSSLDLLVRSVSVLHTSVCMRSRS